jgi:hypothetical protein
LPPISFVLAFGALCPTPVFVEVHVVLICVVSFISTFLVSEFWTFSDIFQKKKLIFFLMINR